MFSPCRLLLAFTFSCLAATVFAAETPAPRPGGRGPAEAALNPALPTIWIAGDSTAAPGGPNSTGWGVPFPSYFDLTKVNIANRARGGRSSRTFIAEGAWDRLIEGVKAGDIVLIQFGHNDGGAINAEPPESKLPLRARGSIKGLGEESEEIDNVVTKKREVVHTFGWYLRKMIADVKAKKATPILLSLTVRNIWQNGKVERGSGKYGEWSAAVAKAAGVPFIDLTTLVADEYDRRGEEAVKSLFPADHTHTGVEGADLNASKVVAGLRALKGVPADKYLATKGRGVRAATKWAGELKTVP
jgi:lysophospholipase L1-like esterase